MKENSEIFQQEDEFIVKLRSFILRNISDPDLNGDKIGSHFALSRVHLYRKLKALDQPVHQRICKKYASRKSQRTTQRKQIECL